MFKRCAPRSVTRIGVGPVGADMTVPPGRGSPAAPVPGAAAGKGGICRDVRGRQVSRSRGSE